jgi:hypothetical protein
MLCAGRPSARMHLPGPADRPDSPALDAFPSSLPIVAFVICPFVLGSSSMTSKWDYGAEVATVVLASFAHTTSHWHAVELHACTTESPRRMLHQASEGRSFVRHRPASELPAPLPHRRAPCRQVSTHPSSKVTCRCNRML